MILICGCASQQTQRQAAEARYRAIKDAIYIEAERAYGPRSTWSYETSYAVASTAADAMTRALQKDLREIDNAPNPVVNNYVEPNYVPSGPQNVWVRRLGQPDELVQTVPAY